LHHQKKEREISLDQPGRVMQEKESSGVKAYAYTTIYIIHKTIIAKITFFYRG
jgi:hypothetical protein